MALTVNGTEYIPKNASDNKSEVVLRPPMLTVPSRKLATELAQMAPHLRASFAKAKGFVGSKPGAVLKVHLPIAPTVCNSTVTSGIFQTSLGLAANFVAGVADWEAVFAEYRIVKGDIHVTPLFLATGTTFGQIVPFACFGIDYDAITANVGSLSAAAQLDSSKVITHITTKPVHFPFNFEKLFGEIWVDVGTYTTFGSLKAYGSGYGASITSAFVVSGFMDLEYRGFQ